MKLKLNISVESIAAIFDLSPKTCTRWFNETLPIMAEISKEGVCWLPKHTIKERMPPAFKELCPGCRCIIDCTEIFIEKPATQEQNILCFSCYKSHLTGKILIVTAPSGLRCVLILNTIHIHIRQMALKVICHFILLIWKFCPLKDIWLVFKIMQDKLVCCIHILILNYQYWFS